jgi:hypothetical protein
MWRLHYIALRYVATSLYILRICLSILRRQGAGMGIQGSLSWDLMWFDLQLTQKSALLSVQSSIHWMSLNLPISYLSIYHIFIWGTVLHVSSCHNCGTMSYSLCLEIYLLQIKTLDSVILVAEYPNWIGILRSKFFKCINSFNLWRNDKHILQGILKQLLFEKIIKHWYGIL